MTTKALTAALIVQFVSIASLTSIPYGLMFSDANRFIRLNRDAVGCVVRQSAAVLISRHIRRLHDSDAVDMIALVSVYRDRKHDERF